MDHCASSSGMYYSQKIVLKKRKKHMTDAQTATADEHMKLIQEDRSLIDSEFVNMTPDNIPEWFDEELFKRGQKFQEKNLLAFATIYLCGLLAIISTPGILNVLTFTKQSSTPCLAFKRYAGTLLLMRMLYANDILDENLQWFKALNIIRAKHVVGTRNHLKKGFHGIYHRDMAITQFGFMGFAFTAAERVGLAHRTQKDLEGLNHYWQVTGHLLGINDRLNICRKTVAETTELCNRIMKDILAKHLEKPSPKFLTMVDTLMTGLWYGDFSLNKDAVLTLTYDMTGTKYPVPLNWYAYINMKQREFALNMCSIPYIGIVVRTIFNCLLNVLYIIIVYCPISAWIFLGKENVQIVHYAKI